MLSRGVIKHSCNEQTSSLWGCYSPVPYGEHRWEIYCPHCLLNEDEPCDVCNNTRRIPQYTCPNSILNKYPQIEMIYSQYLFFKRYSILPEGNIPLDNSSTFMESIVLIDVIHDRIDREIESKNKFLKGLSNA